MQNSQETQFQSAKAHAYFDGLWPYCEHSECRKRKRCSGGPRGTARKSGAIPHCKQIVSRVQERQGLHQSKRKYGEEPDKTGSEESWFDQEMARLSL